MFQILVVEDNKELRDLFCTVLTDNGYTAIPATDGMNAFDILDHTYVDLIISDVMMPVMDGFEMIRAVREARYTMPILIITAKEDPADKQEGFRSGTDDYMVKPIDVNEMVWRVEALLRRSQIVSQRKTQLGSTVFDCDALTVRCGSSVTELPQISSIICLRVKIRLGEAASLKSRRNSFWGSSVTEEPHRTDFDIVTVRGLGYKVVKKQHE